VVLGSTQPITEISIRNLPGDKARPARKSDNLTAICEPIVWNIRDPRRLTTIWASTAFYLTLNINRSETVFKVLSVFLVLVVLSRMRIGSVESAEKGLYGVYGLLEGLVPNWARHQDILTD
jgi:hypothetical protein